MPKADPSQRMLVSGLIVSVVVHAALWVAASGFVRVPTVGTMSRVARVTPSPAEPPKPVVKLGIDDGINDGLSWLGFKEETPHQGLPAPVEQAAMTPAPGTPAPPSKPQAVPAISPQATPPLISSRQVQEAAQVLSDLGAKLSQAKKATPPAPDAPPASSTSQSNSGANAQSANAGLPADKEAVGTSVKSALQVKLGQVAAADGLDIQTKSPTWSMTTLLTKRPANPTIQITFGANGRVIRASFATTGQRIHNTGWAEVDEPLLSAVYSWTARGKRLAELTSRDPSGEVTIVITVLLNS